VLLTRQQRQWLDGEGGPALRWAMHFNRQGDVLVARNTSPSFNVVMPMVSAIVTDRGGQLSHAAIVAREYGVPAVVGTRNATHVIADGSRVRVDGEAGTVEMIS
jgi:phosphoenolpyruvate synthase/pyruvate phosphate dikinase